MAIDVAALLTENDLLLLFTVIGVLLTALVFGHFGFKVPGVRPLNTVCEWLRGACQGRLIRRFHLLVGR